MVYRFSNKVICLSDNTNGKLSFLFIHYEVEDNLYKPICICEALAVISLHVLLTQCNAKISNALIATTLCLRGLAISQALLGPVPFTT